MKWLEPRENHAQEEESSPELRNLGDGGRMLMPLAITVCKRDGASDILVRAVNDAIRTCEWYELALIFKQRAAHRDDLATMERFDEHILMAADMVQQANSGHPGAAMGCACECHRAGRAIAVLSTVVKSDGSFVRFNFHLDLLTDLCPLSTHLFVFSNEIKIYILAL